MTQTLRAFHLARPTKLPYVVGSFIALLTLGLSCFILVMSFAPRFVHFVSTEAGLVIKGDIYGRTIAWKDLDLQQSKSVSELKEAGFEPVRRVNGLGLPDYQSGWFKLKNGETGLLFTSQWSKTIHLPTSLGYHLLISPEDPAGFLASITQRKRGRIEFALARSDQPRTYGWVIYLPVAITMGVGVLMLSIMRSIRTTEIIVGEEALSIKAICYSRSIRNEQLDLAQARITNMKSYPTLRGVFRTNGIGLPGFLAGWFRQFRLGSLLLFVTQPTQVVVVPTHEGYSLVVSPEDPIAILDELNLKCR